MFSRMRISVGLMLISILLIVAFQFWWLRKTYREEAQTLNLRTGILFRETVQRLQVSKIKIDTTLQKHIPSESDMVGVMNVLKERVRDSILPPGDKHERLIVSINKDMNQSEANPDESN